MAEAIEKILNGLYLELAHASTVSERRRIEREIEEYESL